VGFFSSLVETKCGRLWLFAEVLKHPRQRHFQAFSFATKTLVGYMSLIYRYLNEPGRLQPLMTSEVDLGHGQFKSCSLTYALRKTNLSLHTLNDPFFDIFAIPCSFRWIADIALTGHDNVMCPW
jgi:hypothetical protein